MSHTIIIKKHKQKKTKALSSSGWKIALADLMIALMTFFLCMWILEMLNQDEKAQLKQYLKQGYIMDNRHIAQHHSTLDNKKINQQKPTNQLHYNNQKLNKDDEKIKQEILNILNKIDNQKSVIVQQVSHGVKLTLIDNKAGTMFYKGSNELTPYYENLLLQLSISLKTLHNNLIIIGHTDATQYSGKHKKTNWELSTERANTARLYLERGGLPKQKIFQVTGMGDSKPLITKDPNHPLNRRIEIMILNSYSEKYLTNVYNNNASEVDKKINKILREYEEKK